MFSGFRGGSWGVRLYTREIVRESITRPIDHVCSAHARTGARGTRQTRLQINIPMGTIDGDVVFASQRWSVRDLRHGVSYGLC